MTRPRLLIIVAVAFALAACHPKKESVESLPPVAVRTVTLGS